MFVYPTTEPGIVGGNAELLRLGDATIVDPNGWIDNIVEAADGSIEITVNWANAAVPGAPVPSDGARLVWPANGNNEAPVGYPIAAGGELNIDIITPPATVVPAQVGLFLADGDDFAGNYCGPSMLLDGNGAAASAWRTGDLVGNTGFSTAGVQISCPPAFGGAINGVPKDISLRQVVARLMGATNNHLFNASQSTAEIWGAPIIGYKFVASVFPVTGAIGSHVINFKPYVYFLPGRGERGVR